MRGVELLRPVANAQGAWPQGMRMTVEDELAGEWVDSGDARYIDEPETATFAGPSVVVDVPGVQTATRPRPRHRKRQRR